MKPHFKKALKELNLNLDIIFLFDSLAGSIVVFLVSFLILSVFNVSYVFAVIPAVMYFVVQYYIRFYEDKARLVESRYSELKEILRTAEDNVNIENPIVENLQSDVIGKLKHVRMSSFLNARSISYKIFLSIILCFAIISLSVFGINIKLVVPLIEKIPFFNHNSSSLGLLANDTVPLSLTDEIYGDDSVAKLGNSLIDIKIKPSSFEVGVKDTGTPKTKDFYEAFPSEVNAEKATAYEESVPKEQQDLVKNYFKKVSGDNKVN